MAIVRRVVTLLVVLCVTLPLVLTNLPNQAFANSLRASGKAYLTLDGSPEAERAALPLADEATMQVQLASYPGPVLLGAPVADAVVVLGDCAFGPLCWIGSSLWGGLQNVGSVVMECVIQTNNPINRFHDLFGFEQLARCGRAVAHLFVSAVGWVLSVAMSTILRPVYEMYVEAAKEATRHMLEYIVGGTGASAVALSCAYAEDRTNCVDGWFTSQVYLMQRIGIFILIPLLLLVVIQSIMKASLFYLLRAFFVMLPAAFIGGVLMVAIGQILADTVDQWTNWLVGQTLNTENFYGRFDDAFDRLRQEGVMSLAPMLWILCLLVAMLIVMMELLFRHVAIYLSSLFIPIAFMTMVYPATVRWARRAVEILISMIFMKFFVAGALLLGLRALAGADGIEHSITASVTEMDPNDQALHMIITGGAMFFFAGFTAMKMMAPLPVSMTGEARLVQPQSVFTNGDTLQARIKNIIRFTRNRNEGIRGSQRMVNTASRSSDDSTSAGSGGSDGASATPPALLSSEAPATAAPSAAPHATVASPQTATPPTLAPARSRESSVINAPPPEASTDAKSLDPIAARNAKLKLPAAELLTQAPASSSTLDRKRFRRPTHMRKARLKPKRPATKSAFERLSNQPSRPGLAPGVRATSSNARLPKSQQGWRTSRITRNPGVDRASPSLVVPKATAALNDAKRA